MADFSALDTTSQPLFGTMNGNQDASSFGVPGMTSNAFGTQKTKTNSNDSYKQGDLLLWEEYNRTKSSQVRDKLLKRFDGIINAQVNKWAGPVPRQVLLTEARMLAVKAFDSYKPGHGAALATHVTNNLQPISRIVYTYQNTARIPENTAMRISAYNTAVENLKAFNGYEPTIDELHKELGWPKKEIQRVQDYNHRDLVESGPKVDGTFFDTDDDEDLSDFTLSGIYAELTPEEQKLFKMTTGYNGTMPATKPMSNPQIMAKTGLTQAQLSYKKTLLTKKVQQLMKRYGV